MRQLSIHYLLTYANNTFRCDQMEKLFSSIIITARREIHSNLIAVIKLKTVPNNASVNKYGGNSENWRLHNSDGPLRIGLIMYPFLSVPLRIILVVFEFLRGNQ